MHLTTLVESKIVRRSKGSKVEPIGRGVGLTLVWCGGHTKYKAKEKEIQVDTNLMPYFERRQAAQQTIESTERDNIQVIQNSRVK